MCVLCTSTNRPRLDLVLNKQGGKDMRQLQMFQKVEYGGGPIFKVALECKKRCYEPFLIYTFGIQYDFIYFGLYLLNPHDQTVQNMYGKGESPEVYPYSKRERNTLGSVPPN